MHRPDAPISLADLSAAGVRLRPYEAVTLVRELLLQVVRGEIPGVPSPHVIRLFAAGTVSVEGPVAAGGGGVARAAQLLDAMLPSAGGGSQFRIPGGLKLAVARGLGQLDLPAYESLETFADALSRFAATDAAATITNVVTSWAESVASRTSARPAELPAPASQAQIERFVAPAALTISDIRRARRATGLSLTQVAKRSRLPVALLRQLEWGYLLNWPAGHYGRTQLIRYARAAGLDEQLVVATITPLIREAESRREALVHQPVTRAVVAHIDPPIEVTVTRVDEPAAQKSREGFMSRRRPLVALGIPALLVIGLLPAWWARSSNDHESAAPGVAASEATGAAAVPTATAAEPVPPPTMGTALRADRAASVPHAATSTIGRQTDREDAAGSAGAAYRLAADGITYSPSFSSIGTAMFYHADEDGKAALVRAETDSRGAVLRITRIVDDDANNFHVRPSPDGSRIAFDSDRDGERAVYVADADGKHVRRVSPEGFAAVPSWSPDGNTLAFVRAESSRSRVWNLWTLDLEKGDLRQITRHQVGQPWGGSWFPDNKRLAYSHEKRLVIHDLRNGTERVFASPKHGRLVRTPAVSPDGRRVIFQVYRDGAWLLDLTDGSMQRVLDDPTAEEYTWSPDGKRVAYHSRKAGGWGVWVMAAR